MSDFDPGEGWREVPATPGVDMEMVAWYDRDNSTSRYWVRDEPVPPLPTEPYTVIRVTWRDKSLPMNREVWLTSTGTWNDDDGAWLHPAPLAESIIDFEVLASPQFTTDDWEHAAENAKRVRHETAKAVLDEVQQRLGRSSWYGDAQLDPIRRKFGVES